MDLVCSKEPRKKAVWCLPCARFLSIFFELSGSREADVSRFLVPAQGAGIQGCSGGKTVSSCIQEEPRPLTDWKVTESLNQARSSLHPHRIRARKGLCKAPSASLSPLPLRVLPAASLALLYTSVTLRPCFPRMSRSDLEFQSLDQSAKTSPVSSPSLPIGGVEDRVVLHGLGGCGCLPA